MYLQYSTSMLPYDRVLCTENYGTLYLTIQYTVPYNSVHYTLQFSTLYNTMLYTAPYNKVHSAVNTQQYSTLFRI